MFGFPVMGIRGAALATLIARITELLLVLVENQKSEVVRIRLRYLMKPGSDAVTMWVAIIPAGVVAAFVLKLPVLMAYFWMNLDEFMKLPAVYLHYKKYKWVRNLTVENDTDNKP